jgi:small subunit ribosomal protein S14
VARTSQMVQRKLKFQVRHRNRCKVCGRSRAYLRKFAMCRICFRKYSLEGQVPGVIKSSW